MKAQPALFENHEIRRVYDEATDTWWFSVIDIIQVLTQQPDFQATRNYWKVLKNRLGKEGSEVVTKCNRLKMLAADGKQRLTDVATAETLLRLVQSENELRHRAAGSRTSFNTHELAIRRDSPHAHRSFIGNGFRIWSA